MDDEDPSIVDSEMEQEVQNFIKSLDVTTEESGEDLPDELAANLTAIKDKDKDPLYINPTPSTSSGPGKARKRLHSKEKEEEEEGQSSQESRQKSPKKAKKERRKKVKNWSLKVNMRKKVINLRMQD